MLDFEIFAKSSKPKTEIFYSCGPCLHDPIRSNSVEGQQRRGPVKAQALIFHGFWENGKELITAESHILQMVGILCLPNIELFSEIVFEDILAPTEGRNRGFLPVCETYPNVFPLTKLKMAFSFFRFMVADIKMCFNALRYASHVGFMYIQLVIISLLMICLIWIYVYSIRYSNNCNILMHMHVGNCNIGILEIVV